MKTSRTKHIGSACSFLPGTLSDVKAVRLIHSTPDTIVIDQLSLLLRHIATGFLMQLRSESPN
jgi:hypothetical protein